nr:MAG TPA: hypothetical protein [Caudoviricetes sp.]
MSIKLLGWLCLIHLMYWVIPWCLMYRLCWFRLCLVYMY